LRRPLRGALKRAVALATAVAQTIDHVASRQAASGLYYTVAAITEAHEGGQLAAIGDARRLLLSALTLSHRLIPSDPLAASDQAFEEACFALLLDERAVPLADVTAAIAQAQI
jgi:acyl-CoA dehydrogenase